MAYISIFRPSHSLRVAAVLAVLAQAGVAQTPEAPLPVVPYSGGVFLSQWIPYGKDWVVKGPPTTQRGRANLVVGQMDETRQTPQTPSTRDGGRPFPCWVAPDG